MAVIDMLSRLNADTQVLRARLQTLTRQTSTGFKGEALGDLGADQPRALDLKAEIERQRTYGSAITAAGARARATQAVLDRIQGIAREFADKVAIKLDPNDPQGIGFAARSAQEALGQVAQLLNGQHAGQYLFGGTDLVNPPIPDPGGIAASGFATQIAAAVGGLGGGNAAAVLASSVTAAGSNAAGVTPFSAFLSDPATGLSEARRAVPSADGQTVAYGISANRNAVAVSGGANTTGSWARDLLGGLAVIASLTPASATSQADFRQLASGVRGMLKGAETTLAEEQGALGQTEALLTATQAAQAQTVTALTTQLAGLQEVDMAATITRLQGTQTALQASYTAISQLGSLSLVSFLR
jgi:flagellin-like hook-associated protein FlgL